MTHVIFLIVFGGHEKNETISFHFMFALINFHEKKTRKLGIFRWVYFTLLLLNAHFLISSPWKSSFFSLFLSRTHWNGCECKIWTLDVKLWRKLRTHIHRTCIWINCKKSILFSVQNQAQKPRTENQIIFHRKKEPNKLHWTEWRTCYSTNNSKKVCRYKLRVWQKAQAEQTNNSTVKENKCE